VKRAIRMRRLYITLGAAFAALALGALLAFLVR
jgi:hypothetical protein